MRHGVQAQLAARLVLTAICLLPIQAQFVVETNSLRVREPALLVGEMDVAIGDFGVPLYGATMVGQLVLPPPGNQKGCEPIHKPLTGKLPDLPLILLVVRGDCYFIEKAYNAEQAGAKALLVTDNKSESLLTMSNPEERPELAKLKNDISIPAGLIQKTQGDRFVNELSKPDGSAIVVELDWTDSLVHPDNRVEWQLWTSSNDGCGRACDRQGQFKRDFQDTATTFEKDLYTMFEPHFMHRKCDSPPESQACRDACIHHGRYCAFDSINATYAATFKPRHVVSEDKRQMCIFQLATNASKPWLWWEYAAGYSLECTMANGQFGSLACAERQTQRIGLDPHEVATCMGDDDSDEAHPLLQADLEAQGSRSQRSSVHVLLLPTVVINTNQYRGRLDVPSVTRALCAGFDEATEPDVCLSGSLQEDDCATSNHGCWKDASGKWDACLDTFRGRTCRCPPGFFGDGLTCEDIDECALGVSGCDQICTNTVGGWECSCSPGFLLIGGNSRQGLCLPKDMCSDEGTDKNGGCEMGCTSHNGTATCLCPMVGLMLAEDLRHCDNINECATGNGACEQVCADEDPRTTGMTHVCSCREGFAPDPDNRYKCVEQVDFLRRLGITAVFSGSGIGWGGVIGVVVVAAVLTLGAGFAAYHFRMRLHAQQQIRDIMKQYMPLDGNGAEEDALLRSPTIAAHHPLTNASNEITPALQPGGTSSSLV